MRGVVSAAAGLWLFPIAAAGCAGLGLSWVTALVAGALVAGAAAWVAGGRLAAILAPALTGSRAAALLVALLAAGCTLQLGRLAVFMVDANRMAFSIRPNDPFFREHCCFSAYAEAARFTLEGGNVYDERRYVPPGRPGERPPGRYIGTLRVDPYHYPPPFLLLPRALRPAAPAFHQMRALWFALQVLVFAGAVVVIAGWLGGPAGAWTLAGGLLVLLLPTTAFGLQQGNFQMTATPLALGSLALLAGGRQAPGALGLAYAALSKIFPGVLVVMLVAARRWRAAAWTAGAGVLLLVLTVGVLGPQPFRDFVGYELPLIADGRAFPQTERPQVVPSNLSMYGLTVKLRLLGVEALDQRTGLLLTSVYGLLVLAIAAWAGWRVPWTDTTTAGRLRLLQLALALLGLASFRSPFVGAAYGMTSTLWLLTLLAAGAGSGRTRGAWLLGAVALSLVVLWLPTPSQAVWTSGIVLSVVVFLAALAVNAWCAISVGLRRGERVTDLPEAA
ncbi:MAG TPA: glycosyltransferase 87 family protein [Vicinamibacterales bacterium]